MKKILSVTLLPAVILAVFSGCFGGGTSTTEETVRVSGSTSMHRVASALLEGFAEVNSDIKTDLQAGGSSTGVSNMLDGISNIGNASRALKQEEVDKGAVPNVIALDAITLIANSSVTVTNLTKQQVNDIYTGKITNWKEVGGEDQNIVVIGREASSGTRSAFEEIVGIKDKIIGQELTETGTVKSSVASTEGAIGYISLEALDETVKTINFEGVKATIETVKNESYTLAREFVMATKSETSESVKKFLDFVYSDNGRAIIEKVGLVPVSRK